MACRTKTHWTDEAVTRIVDEVWPFEKIKASWNEATGEFDAVDLTGTSFRLQILDEPGGTVLHSADITPVEETIEATPTQYGTLEGDFWVIRTNVDLSDPSEALTGLAVGTYSWGLWEISPRYQAEIQGSLTIVADSGGGEVVTP